MFSSFVAEPDRTALEDASAVGLMLFFQINGHLIHCCYQGMFAHKPINATKFKPKKLSELQSGKDRHAVTLKVVPGKNFRLTVRCYLVSSQQRSEVVPMELPHWLMAAGTLLLVLGFVGAALHKNAQATSDTDSWEGDRTAEAQTPTNPPSVAAAS
jgi:hypothetical protein